MMSDFETAFLFVVFLATFVNVYAVLQVLSYLNWKRKWRENRNV
jgi:hypothetical protein